MAGNGLPGRRSKLTVELQKTIVDAISDGMTDKDAFTLAGIKSAAFYSWLKEGEVAQKGRKKEFSDAVVKARAAFVEKHVRNIKRAAFETRETVHEHVKEVYRQDKDGKQVKVEEIREVRRDKHLPTWQASAWLLERRKAGEYGRRIIQHEGQEGGPIQFAQKPDMGELSSDEIRSLKELALVAVAADADQE